MIKKPENDAAEVMGGTIRKLAEQRPDLCDESGRGFWPVPVHFPHLLSHTLNALQRETSLRYLHRDPVAKELATVREQFVRVVAVGDLGENHTELYLADHPQVATISPDEAQRLPFARFCNAILSIDDPILLLAILTRNEEGSLAEAEQMAATRLIKPDGVFARTHLVEEEVHGAISVEIRDRLMRIREFQERFVQGLDQHDQLYFTILDQPHAHS